jgi:putative oxidoreductase
MDFLSRLRPLALFLLRVGLGIIFIYHGYPKLFTRTHEMMQAFPHMGFPGYFVYIAGILECAGGLMLVLGLFTPIAGLLLALEMAVVIWRVHLPMGPPTEVKNYELPLALCLGAFTLAAFGAGKISLDYPLFAHRIRGGGPPRPRPPKKRS